MKTITIFCYNSEDKKTRRIAHDIKDLDTAVYKIAHDIYPRYCLAHIESMEKWREEMRKELETTMQYRYSIKYYTIEYKEQ